MKKKDILELKRRLTKNNCTFSRICGCYVDVDKNIVTTFGETFLNLPDEEFYKYLNIAKGIFKGKLKDNMLNLELSEEAKEEKRHAAVPACDKRQRLKRRESAGSIL